MGMAVLGFRPRFFVRRSSLGWWGAQPEMTNFGAWQWHGGIMALLLEWNYATLFELHSQVTPTLEILWRRRADETGEAGYDLRAHDSIIPIGKSCLVAVGCRIYFHQFLVRSSVTKSNAWLLFEKSLLFFSFLFAV